MTLPHSTRFRVNNNLPGNKNFCSLVRRTKYLNEMIAHDLREKTRETLARYDQDILRRAAGYLYLKETQSSFEVEREKPSADRAQRFADLLRQADTREVLTEERLVQLQQAVVDSRFHEFTWRHQQNWVGKDHGYRQLIDFIPPRPEDVPELMAGLLSLAEASRNWFPYEPGPVTTRIHRILPLSAMMLFISAISTLRSRRSFYTDPYRERWKKIW